MAEKISLFYSGPGRLTFVGHNWQIHMSVDKNHFKLLSVIYNVQNCKVASTESELGNLK